MTDYVLASTDPSVWCASTSAVVMLMELIRVP